MRYAVCLSMFARRWTDALDPYFLRIREAGFDGVELSLYGADPAALTRSTVALRQAGLAVTCGTGIGADTDITASDATVRAAGVAYLRECVDQAAEMGSPMLNGVLYAPWQAFGEPGQREQRWAHSAACLRGVADYAKTRGITLHLEVLNRFESDMFNTLAEGSVFLRLIDRPNVKMLVDTFHMNIEEADMIGALQAHLEDIGCIHVCENHRGVPGTGHIPWADIFTVLHAGHYAGFLTMECFVEAGTEVGNALHIWHDSGADPLTEARRGCAYLRGMEMRQDG